MKLNKIIFASFLAFLPFQQMSTYASELLLATGNDSLEEIKVKRVNKPFARKIQILTVLEQRAKVQGKNRQAQIARAAKEDLRAKNKKKTRKT